MSILFPFQNWKPALAIKVFFLILIFALIIAVLYPALWLSMVGIVFFSHLFLRIAGLFPRSKLLGPNITRLPDEAARRGEVAITIDDGPEPVVTPQVLDILDRYRAKATFFCIGRRAEQYPELCHEIVRRGHAIENHSQSHYWFLSLLGPWRTYREVHQAQIKLSEICGVAPRFFRPTAGLRNLVLEPVLLQCNLRLCSWSKRGFDTRVDDADKVLNSLTRNLRGGDIFLLHDGHAAKNALGTPVIIDVLPRLLDALNKVNLHSVTLRSAIP